MIAAIRRNWFLLAVCTGASLAICLTDCLIPRGFVISSAYAVVVAITVAARSRQFTLAITVETTVLTVVGTIFSPAGVHASLVLVNRSISVLVAWMIAWLLLRAMRFDEARQQAALAREAALDELKVLQGILPICSRCKKIRDDAGRWESLEVYIAEHSQAAFTHGICKDCARELYGDLIDDADASESTGA